MKGVLSAVVLFVLFCLACGSAEVAPTPTPGGFATIADPRLAGTIAAIQATRFAVNTVVAANLTAQAATATPTAANTPLPTNRPLVIPTAARAPIPVETIAPNRAVDAAFAAWMTSTACVPNSADSKSAWCDTLTSVSFSGDMLILRTTLTANDPDLLALMVYRLSGFVYDSLYVRYKIANIVVVSDATGVVLARRRGLSGAIELFP